MLRTGIHKVEQLLDSAAVDCYGLIRPISISLYDQIQHLESAEQLGERILFQFSNARATFKRTYSRRFEEFDQNVYQLLKTNFSASKPFFFHDIAISDGRTACEFFEKLVSHYPQLDFWASDYDAAVTVFEDGCKKLALSEEGQPLELVVPPFVFNLVMPPSWKRYPFHRIAQWYYSATILPRLKRLADANPQLNRSVKLFSQRTLKLAALHPNFHLLTYNLLNPFQARQDLHAVRAMNVLNSAYFNPRERNLALSNIHASLQIGGVLISGSNSESNSLDGGVYRKNSQGYELIIASGSGHPWHSEIQAWNIG